MVGFRTTANLNLRSGPGTDEAILSVLPKNHLVELLDDLPDQPGWWRVRTRLRSAAAEGFVSNRFLRPAEEEPAGPSGGPPQPLPVVHMPNPNAHAVTRAGTRRAYALNEAGAPGGAFDADQLWQIVDWLDVERGAHVRFRPITGGSTFCNIYAYDVICLAGRYLPRCWWTRPAIARLRQGQTQQPVYDQTIREMNANSLHDWLSEFGPEFGWRRAASLTEAQNAANAGALATIAATTGTAASGHITIVLPERGGHAARRSGSRVVAPLQSQAGRRNYRAHANDWWDTYDYAAWGAWIAD